MVFVDVGANAGWFTLIASRLVGNTGFVYSFEPDPRNFQALCDSVYRDNSMTNCVVLPIALSNREQIVSLSRPKFDDGTGAFMSSGGTKKVLCARLDHVLRNLPDRPIHVKVDVEAAEFLAIDGFGDTMKRVTSFAVEVSGQSMERFGVPFADLFTLMSDNGFSSSRLNKDGGLTEIDVPETGDIVFQRRTSTP
jgi:FkbM family methyltransferase